MRDCPKCGKSIQAAATRCIWCFEKSEPVRKPLPAAQWPDTGSLPLTEGSAATPQPRDTPAREGKPSSASRYATSVERRYRDAYVTAAAIVAKGQAMKTTAAIVAALVVSATLVLTMRAGGLAVIVLGAGAIVAAGAYAIIHSAGVRIAAEGQALLATLDVAVNTSPFLDDNGRAQAMSLYQS